MTIQKAQLELLPLRTFSAHVFGRLAREALRLGGGRLPVGIRWMRRELMTYTRLPSPPEAGGPDYITLVPSDFDGLSVKQTVMNLESLFIAPYAYLGCRPLTRRVGLKDDSEARRILARCDRIKALLRRANLDVRELMEGIRSQDDKA